MIYLILGIMLVGSQGGGGVVMMMVVGFIYAAFASSIIRSHYLGRGWEEVGSWNQAPQAETMRKCPFCAEEIRREAVKCKHCGSDVEPFPEVTVEAVKAEPVAPRPQNFPLG